MFGFHFAIYGEMLTYGFLKKKPSFVSPVNDKSWLIAKLLSLKMPLFAAVPLFSICEYCPLSHDFEYG